MNNLVVVESPAKSVTIGRYLNDKNRNLNDKKTSNSFKILATGGHIYESNKVDIEDGFKLNYELIPSKRKNVDSIVKEMRKADRLYLATDPDREGEAISAHVLDLLEKRGALKQKEVHRIVFHEVTQQAVLNSIENPGDISQTLVQAQQSRDALDWLVGFNLSPLLIRKLRTPHLSAGRVQSPALRLIVERQREIDRFVATEYWTIAAELGNQDSIQPIADSKPIEAQLTHLDGHQLKKHEIGSEAQAGAAVESIEQALKGSHGKLTVAAINRKQRKRKPPVPFKTSSFVQSASQRLKRSAADVARIAQKLYEGLEIKGTLTGLITYTRTDSITLSSSATNQIRNFVAKTYGQENMPKSARTYKTKSKNAQEAHEAIRPTDIFLTPSKVRPYLNQEQFLVYRLIWERSVACQMNDAIYADVSVQFQVADHQFRTSGSTLVSPGWLAVLDSSDREQNTGKDKSLPPFTEGDLVAVDKIRKDQHFTQPPPRFNTGSLIKQLEEYGIGRPSTWPSIITKLVDRNYVIVQNQSFYAQSLGCMVVDYLNMHFALYVDYGFTGKVEDRLDEIARGESERLPLLNRFWKEFSEHLNSKLAAPGFEIVLGPDPDSGRELLVRVRHGGSFLQLGRRTDEEKPLFRSLPRQQDPSLVTLDYAIEQFSAPSLPRTLDERSSKGEVIEIKSGRYGPYFSCTDEAGKVESYNLDDSHDPMSVTIEEIEKILAQPKLPRSIGKNDEFADIVANRGRFGPYLSVTRASGEKFNVSLGKTLNPATVTLDQALEIVRGAKQRRSSRTVIKAFEKEKIQILDGRYGPYVTDGKTNATIPSSLIASDLDLQTCQELLAKKKQAKSRKSPAPRRRKKSG